ncbi:plasmid recombination protein [Anaerocolumna xylanovorans]|uniref:Plasmid recombination enzyme n=1 Tax=Anaerocolumna xylanovorans DSM 12503 TaxID=1121345 RepID=A0A1M7YG63_9FIRM|nr:plasmid recombination protein [Anaerocolumna xylanovorans]SHO51571.1 Plasmid recombination enzyme [Anaerocolumna xylanovorans DSM 12503]
MANVCIVRHQGHIKSKMHFPYQHNFRKLKNYGNKNIDASLSHLNTNIVNNLKDGETYLTAFNRMYESGEFKGQLKVQGAVDKQTKFLDEFLVYPPNEKISEMSLEEQDIFFKKVLQTLQKYFPDMIILSAQVHRDEVFHPLDEEMKALFPEGKVTPHMHVIAIPIVHDKKKDCKKVSITELWKGQFSYRKFQDYMYNAVGKKYGFDRGEMHDFGEAQKHLEVEEFKLKEAKKSLKKLEPEIIKKEQELAERAKDIEPEEQINLFNIKDVIKQQKAVNYALKIEREKNSLLQKEKESLNQTVKDKDELILAQNQEIQNQQKKLSEIKKELSLEKDKTNDILNIKVSDERLRQVYLDESRQKIKLYDIIVRIIKDFLPELIKASPKFIRELLDYKILHKEDLHRERENNRHKGG